VIANAPPNLNNREERQKTLLADFVEKLDAERPLVAPEF
jgi:hypothetical protein